MKFITHRPLWVNVIVAIIIALGIFFVFISLLNMITQHGKWKTVPSVIGKNLEEARDLLEDQGFEVVIQDSVYQDTVPRGAVIKQIPESDATVKVHRTVYLTINRSIPPVIEMPNLVGYSFRNAQMVLTNLGLRVGDTTFKPDFAKNSVLEQIYNGSSITPGTGIQMGSIISLVLGDGVGNTEFVVPSIVGMNFSQAKMLLEANGISFAAVIAPGVTDTMNAYIYKQNPQRFDEDGRRLKIRPGQTMDVWLSVDKPDIDSSEVKNQPDL